MELCGPGKGAAGAEVAEEQPDGKEMGMTKDGGADEIADPKHKDGHELAGATDEVGAEEADEAAALQGQNDVGVFAEDDPYGVDVGEQIALAESLQLDAAAFGRHLEAEGAVSSAQSSTGALSPGQTSPTRMPARPRQAASAGRSSPSNIASAQDGQLSQDDMDASQPDPC
jgi:hypothetical protein